MKLYDGVTKDWAVKQLSSLNRQESGTDTPETHWALRAPGFVGTKRWAAAIQLRTAADSICWKPGVAAHACNLSAPGG